MASIKEICYDLILHARPSMVDDDDLDYRSVKFWVKNQRALWLKNELAKHHETNDDIIQSLDAQTVTGSTTLKYTSAIPVPLTVNGDPQITRVGPTDDSEIDYKFGSYKHSKHYGNGRFNEDFIFAYYKDNKVYIKGSDLSLVSSIDVRGVFEDPLDVSGMTDDSEYPMPDSLIPYLKGEIIKLDLSRFLIIKNDNMNDGSNNLN